jgi:protein disulfide-isomerase
MNNFFKTQIVGVGLKLISSIGMNSGLFYLFFATKLYAYTVISPCLRHISDDKAQKLRHYLKVFLSCGFNMKNFLLCLQTHFRMHDWSCVKPAHADVARPYDETADAPAAVAKALTQAQASNKKVLVIFGANWCKDCLELDRSMQGQSAALIASKFVLVKVDVGQFDKNLALANSYGNPIKKGIPAAVVLKADNSVLFASKGGELSNARKMSEQGVYDFFNQIITQHP